MCTICCPRLLQSLATVQMNNAEKLVQNKAFLIGHFRVAVNLFMKARLSAKILL